ncbi:hypothetical protein [Granulicella sp. L46]|jgi:hypothetical protein|uniref:hypothetical protein n=1 Tax=Granulicella sp. L46 TaxID=1641865 RepID=UPI00131D4B24|nr:hypothetical protein [Granulicella sp. L46]
MGQRCRALFLCIASATSSAQQPTPPADATPPTMQPFPPTTQLLLDVERNQKASEAANKDYTYHVHIEQQELDRKGEIKKTDTTDSESLTIEGIRVDRTVARNGKPLSDKDVQKESDRLDKEVAKAKEHREKLASEGKPTDARGDDLLTVSRILELGTFSNPRRVDLNGRPTIVLDYAGDPNAKTHNEFEKVFRDLVGTAWIDEQDHVLVRGQGHFLHDFKVGGGLVLNIHQGLSFDFTATHITDNIWLPAAVDAQGSGRFLLFDGINGRFHLVTSDYRKFHSKSTIIDSNRLIGPDGQPIPDPPPPSTTPPQP